MDKCHVRDIICDSCHTSFSLCQDCEYDRIRHEYYVELCSDCRGKHVEVVQEPCCGVHFVAKEFFRDYESGVLFKDR